MKKIDTRSAEEAFSVANTPLFLLRKLRADAAVLELSRIASSSDVMKMLKKSLRKKPQNLTESVAPYVFLAAIAKDIDCLREAKGLAAPYADWFSYLVNILIETYQPTITQTIEVPLSILSPNLRATSTAPVSQRTIEVDR